jgi:dihydrofolate reductase
VIEIAAEVVDELVIGVYPVLLGNGIRLFPGGFPRRDLRLVESKTYEPERLSGTEISRIR